MAYSNSGLSVLAQNMNNTVWAYRTNDTAATVITAGYFSAANDKIKRHDQIHVSHSLATAPGVLRLNVSAAAVGGAVTVTGGVAAPTAAPAGGTGATAGAYDTAANRDIMIGTVNALRTAMINHGLLF